MARDVLLLATNNAKKAKELAAIAEGFTVMTQREAGIDLEVVEDADTFGGNAIKKAQGVAGALAALPLADRVFAVLADDSGLCVDALDGGPGVRSARFAQDHDAGQGDDDNNALLFEKLSGVPDEDRGAHFACAICAVLLPGGELIEAYGEVRGHIAHDLRGAGGFGYDPLFIPEAHPGQRMAELSATEKHAISHRGQAVRTAVTELFARRARSA